MNSKEQVVWAREFEFQMERGASDVDAYQYADARVAALRKQLGGHGSDTDAVVTETPAEYADRVVNVLQQCVKASFTDVSDAAGHVLIVMLRFATQRAVERPISQAQHHHVRCEVTKIPPGLSIGTGACFVWKEQGGHVSPSHDGVVSKVMDHGSSSKSFDAIVYGPCPPIGATIMFDAPSITLNVDGDVVVSPVLARVNAIIA